MADVRRKPPREEAKPNSPVRWIPADEERGKPESGIGLCLSGGGYRAMLFHVGALWRLNELGYLEAAEPASPASPAARSAGGARSAVGQLEFTGGPGGPSGRRQPEGTRGRRRSVARRQHPSTCPRSSPACCCRARRSAQPRRRLPPPPVRRRDPAGPAERRGRPRFVINATNLQSGVLWRFSRPYMATTGSGRSPSRR